MGSTKINMPEPRDLGEEADEIAQVNLRYAPQQYSLESQYRPKYAALDREISWDNLFADNGILNMGLKSVEAIGDQNRLANTAQREADVADATRLGGDVQALQQQMNPELQALMEQADAKALAGSGESAAQSALAQSLGLSPLPGSLPNGAAGPVMLGSRGAPTTPAQSMGGRRGTPGAGPIDQATVTGGTGMDRNRVNLAGVNSSYDAPTVDASGLQVGNRGASSVLQAMSQRAANDLALGGSLDSRAAQEIEQNVLAQYNQMGRSMDNRAMAAIAGELDKGSEARLNSRFGRALGAEGALQSQQAANIGIDQGNQAMGLEALLANQRSSLATNEMNQQGQIAGGQLAIGASGANQAADTAYRQGLLGLNQMEGQRSALDFANLQQAVGNRLATQFDPFAGVLGRSSLNNTSFGQQRASGNFNQNPSGGMEAFNQYAGQLNSQNFGEASESARAQAQINADMAAGAMGAVGGIAGGMI